MGVPGCGKSTWAENNAEGAVIVSSDAIQGPGPYNPSDNTRVFETFHSRIERALGDGKDVIADATNVEVFARAKLRRIARDCDAKTRLVVFDNLIQAVARNDRRDETRVPDDAMKRMLMLYTRQRRYVETEQYDSVLFC
jgi:predicted kinase